MRLHLHREAGALMGADSPPVVPRPPEPLALTTTPEPLPLTPPTDTLLELRGVADTFEGTGVVLLLPDCPPGGAEGFVDVPGATWLSWEVGGSRGAWSEVEESVGVSPVWEVVEPEEALAVDLDSISALTETTQKNNKGTESIIKEVNLKVEDVDQSSAMPKHTLRTYAVYIRSVVVQFYAPVRAGGSAGLSLLPHILNLGDLCMYVAGCFFLYINFQQP